MAGPARGRGGRGTCAWCASTSCRWATGRAPFPPLRPLRRHQRGQVRGQAAVAHEPEERRHRAGLPDRRQAEAVNGLAHARLRGRQLRLDLGGLLRVSPDEGIEGPDLLLRGSAQDSLPVEDPEG